MAEYIEREKLISQIRLTASRSSVGETSLNDISVKTICSLILEAPTADVVEVVRCKDCKHRYVPCHCALWYGTADGKEYFIERGDDFSCSYGKKKEGAENDL